MAQPVETSAVRVLVVDDHPVFRSGMCNLIESCPELTVAGEAGSGEAALLACAEAPPDVVLMDLRMPGMGGLAATASMRLAHPDTAVLVLTMNDDDDSVFAALRAGASGYLLKEAEGEDIRRAVVGVAAGHAVFGPRVAARVMAFFAASAAGRPDLARAPFPQLTAREREILELVAGGLDNASIARRLVLSPKTVRNRVSDVLAKLHARSRAEMVALARDAGLGGTAAPSARPPTSP